MKTISRYLLTLVALFAMTTGAWAHNTVYTSGQSVRIVDLKVGDIILPGATVTRDGNYTPTNQKLKFRRCTTEWVDMSESLPVTFDENAGLGDYHVGGKPLQPIDENGNVGNAWQVAVLTLEPFGYIATLDGITYRDPNAPVISEDGTEAEFEMPNNDLTVEYELVRDMAINMTTTVGDGTEGYRIRLKKEGEGYVLADLSVEEIMNLVQVYDQTEEKYLTVNTDFTTAIYAIDADGQPTGDAIAYASLTPGRYVAIATAVDESNYAGTTPQSNVFELYQGYEVTVPAGEYVTYYRDEALTLDTDETAAELYTITEVSNEVATASKFDVIPANVPLLVKNTSDETRTIVLIPTEDPASFMWYEGFKGTLEATEIAASDDTADRYAFNGKQFVWVESALAVDANKAWLEIPAAANNARTINLVFGETTGIDTVNVKTIADGDWYDLNGRKLQNIPTKKGVYIMNGKKVVVK